MVEEVSASAIERFWNLYNSCIRGEKQTAVLSIFLQLDSRTETSGRTDEAKRNKLETNC